MCTKVFRLGIAVTVLQRNFPPQKIFPLYTTQLQRPTQRDLQFEYFTLQFYSSQKINQINIYSNWRNASQDYLKPALTFCWEFFEFVIFFKQTQVRLVLLCIRHFAFKYSAWAQGLQNTKQRSLPRMTYVEAEYESTVLFLIRQYIDNYYQLSTGMVKTYGFF